MTEQVKIKLNTIKDITEFVETTRHFPIELDIKSGRYVIDASSIMGILSLNLDESVNLVFDTNYKEQVIKDFNKWIID